MNTIDQGEQAVPSRASERPVGRPFLGLRGERAVWAAMLAFQFFVPIVLSRWSHDLPNEDLYRSLAKNLATTGHYVADVPAFFTRAGAPFTSFAPAWPAFLAVGYLLAGPLGFWIVLGLVWCLALVLTDRLAKALALPAPARWVLLAWVTTNPTLLYYHGHLMTEPLALALGLGILIAGIAWLEKPTWRGIALLGAISAIGHLERTMLLLPAAAVLLVGARTIPFRRFVAMAGLFAAVHVAVVAPWLLRMRSVGAGVTATELKLGHNLFQFSNPNVEDPASPKVGETFQWPDDLEDKTPSQRNSELVRLSVEGIRQNPLRYARNCARRLYAQLAPWPKAIPTTRLQSAVITVSALLYMYGSWTLFFVSLRRGARLSRGALTLLVSIGLWYVCHSLIAGSVRMRVPSDPWVPALALAAWASSVGGRRRLSGDEQKRALPLQHEPPLAQRTQRTRLVGAMVQTREEQG